jgi:hypothetical protein
MGLQTRKRDSEQPSSGELKVLRNVIARHSLEESLSEADLKLLTSVWNQRNALYFASRFLRRSVALKSRLGRTLQADLEKRAREHYSALKDAFFGKAEVRLLPSRTLQDLERIL